MLFVEIHRMENDKVSISEYRVENLKIPRGEDGILTRLLEGT